MDTYCNYTRYGYAASSKALVHTGAKEHFFTVTPECDGTFDDQIQRLFEFYASECRKLGIDFSSGVTATIFLSDSANQESTLRELPSFQALLDAGMAVTVVQQPPVSSKCSLFAYHVVRETENVRVPISIIGGLCGIPCCSRIRRVGGKKSKPCCFQSAPLRRRLNFVLIKEGSLIRSMRPGSASRHAFCCQLIMIVRLRKSDFIFAEPLRYARVHSEYIVRISREQVNMFARVLSAFVDNWHHQGFRMVCLSSFCSGASPFVGARRSDRCFMGMWEAFKEWCEGQGWLCITVAPKAGRMEADMAEKTAEELCIEMADDPRTQNKYRILAKGFVACHERIFSVQKAVGVMDKDGKEILLQKSLIDEISDIKRALGIIDAKGNTVSFEKSINERLSGLEPMIHAIYEAVKAKPSSDMP